MSRRTKYVTLRADDAVRAICWFAALVILDANTTKDDLATMGRLKEAALRARSKP